MSPCLLFFVFSFTHAYRPAQHGAGRRDVSSLGKPLALSKPAVLRYGGDRLAPFGRGRGVKLFKEKRSVRLLLGVDFVEVAPFSTRQFLFYDEGSTASHFRPLREVGAVSSGQRPRACPQSAFQRYTCPFSRPASAIFLKYIRVLGGKFHSQDAKMFFA